MIYSSLSLQLYSSPPPLEYNITSRVSDNLPSLLFYDSQDNVKRVNPCYRTNIFRYLNKDLQEKDEDNNFTTKEMRNWYDTSTKKLIEFFCVCTK